MRMWVLPRAFLPLNKKNNRVHVSHVVMFYRQRGQPEELQRIKKHYETSEEEKVKLLDKPEQSVSLLDSAPANNYVHACLEHQSISSRPYLF